LQVGSRPGLSRARRWASCRNRGCAAVAVLRVIDLANIHRNPEALEIMLERQHPAIVAPGRQQQFKAQRLAGAALIRRWFFSTTRLFKQGIGLQQIAAVEAIAAGARRLIDG
jgi:hypothetical protein